MSDLIRREDAIDAICKLPVKVDNLGYTWMIANDVLNQIDDIPSAEPERTAKVTLLTPDSKGYWSTNGRCQGCGFLLERKHVYCPNCGVRLEWDYE